ncbi:sensor histidine kinase [Streptomyces sp. NPDC053048]|uniref:sensor histidine kinase n=1 Tax=Streptomyces sp. NPDC053048 TaxID=3365694 RepID=UPI0037D6C99B
MRTGGSRVLRRGGDFLRRVGDVMIALALTALTVVFALEQQAPEGWRPFDGPAVALTAVIYLPMAFRRQLPWAVLAVSCSGYLTYSAAGYPLSVNVWGPVLAFFTVATLQPTRVVAAAAVPTAVVWTYGSLLTGVLSAPVSVGQTVLVLGIAWGFGASVRQLGLRNAKLADLTRRLQIEQEARARHAVTEERLRIARELHDVVAHHLSVLSVQSGLARYVFDSDPGTARGALETINTTARQTLEDMRGLLQVLRITPDGTDVAGGSPFGPTPGLGDVPGLVERMAAAGVVVEVTADGRWRPLAPGADLCAYRIVQEALTNVLKHAGPARVTVSLAYAAELLTVRVTDDGGRPGGVFRDETGSGQGLIGMRERVRMYGGLFRAGPRQPAGFEVMFTLPIPP